jgi:hypothetical protein
MKFTRQMFRARIATPLVGAVVAVSPLAAICAAHAAESDTFLVETSDADACGGAWFMDYGPGANGGGSNDDYIEIDDYCRDHHGVKAWAWLTRSGTTHYLGSAYDGHGSVRDNHAAKIWDPFRAYGNVIAHDQVGVKVCLVDGSNDPTPTHCQSYTGESADG